MDTVWKCFGTNYTLRSRNSCTNQTGVNSSAVFKMYLFFYQINSSFYLFNLEDQPQINLSLSYTNALNMSPPKHYVHLCCISKCLINGTCEISKSRPIFDHYWLKLECIHLRKQTHTHMHSKKPLWHKCPQVSYSGSFLCIRFGEKSFIFHLIYHSAFLKYGRFSLWKY